LKQVAVDLNADITPGYEGMQIFSVFHDRRIFFAGKLKTLLIHRANYFNIFEQTESPPTSILQNRNLLNARLPPHLLVGTHWQAMLKILDRLANS